MNTTSTQLQRSPASKTLRIFNVLLYTPLVMVGFLYPLGLFFFVPEYYWSKDLTVAAISSMLSTVLGIGVAVAGATLMRKSLCSIPNKHTLEIWTLSALLFAPISGVFYAALMDFFGFNEVILAKGLGTLLLTTALVESFAFSLPFVLITLWLRYRYRQDEF